MRIFDIPLKSNKDVLNVLPSLFEESIDIDGLKFYTKKLEENRYLSFAYDEQKILDAIKNSKLLLSQVSSIHFAQIELESIVKKSGQSCMKLDDVCLSFVDNILVQIPLMLRVNIDNAISLEGLELSKERIYLDSSSKYISNKNTYLLSACFVILSGFLFFKSFSNQSYNDNIQKQIVTLKDQANMPPSMIQTKSIISSMEGRYKRQNSKRKALNYIFAYSKTIKGTMVEFELKEKNITCKFANINKNRIKNYIKEKYKIESESVNNNILTLRVSI